MIDGYTKVILTVIALALSVIALEALTSSAGAQLENSCGSPSMPCYVINNPVDAIFVQTKWGTSLSVN